MHPKSEPLFQKREESLEEFLKRRPDVRSIADRFAVLDAEEKALESAEEQLRTGLAFLLSDTKQTGPGAPFLLSGTKQTDSPDSVLLSGTKQTDLLIGPDGRPLLSDTKQTGQSCLAILSKDQIAGVVSEITALTNELFDPRASLDKMHTNPGAGRVLPNGVVTLLSELQKEIDRKQRVAAGRKGGKIRAVRTTPERRQEIARAAAEARHKKRDDHG